MANNNPDRFRPLPLGNMLVPGLFFQNKPPKGHPGSQNAYTAVPEAQRGPQRSVASPLRDKPAFDESNFTR